MAESEAGSLPATWRMPAILAGILLFAGILFFIDLAPGNPIITRMAAVAALMAFWWITGALPLAATSLLPLVLFPVLGIMSARNTAAQYVNDTIFLFLGGFLVALAMQRWDLHRRVALRLLLLFRVRPRRLLLGFMAATFFISMWISNTATTMMMMPIAMSIISSLQERQNDRNMQQYAVGLLLSIAYASSIGGTATLIGTPPNLSLVRIYEITFPAAPQISFATWMIFALPLALALLLVLWGVMSLQFARRGATLSLSPDIVKKQYSALGRTTWEQKVVFAVSVGLATLWMTRTSINFGSFTLPGWDRLFSNPDYLSDGSVAVAMALLLFLIPSRAQPGAQLMDWETARNVPWDIILLFGGGFALAKGIADSGLAAYVGGNLQGLQGLHPVLLVLLIALAVSFLTELTSNTATAEMLLPVMASLAVGLQLHPLLLMIPATLAASYAFMLPVATPPNAIIFGTRRLQVWDMVKGGVFLNLAAVLLLTLAMFTLGRAVFQIQDFTAPAWATIAPAPAGK